MADLIEVNFGSESKCRSNWIAHSLREAREFWRLDRRGMASMLARQTGYCVTAETIRAWEEGLAVPLVDLYVVAISGAGPAIERLVSDWLRTRWDRRRQAAAPDAAGSSD